MWPKLGYGILQCAVAAAVMLCAACTNAAGVDEDLAAEVYATLQRFCFECHGVERQEAGLRLDGRDALLASGVVEPGDPDTSELFRRVSLALGDDEVMPPRGETVPPQHVATLRRWIEHGAAWPKNPESLRHWAYVPPRRPALPEVKHVDWPRTPLDHFILRRLEDEGLQPSAIAQPEKRIRRVYLDLIGLPPTPAEVDAFVEDPTDAHYEAIVDALLQRPQFGERWARPWLDLARYADSHGFQRDNFRDIWAYRDWVIKALNHDMPFDQFTIQQVAGDLLPCATESQKIATGFHRCAPTNVEAGSLPEETRIEQVIDRVNTTGAVWLGTTMQCCQCHDHKYDPFTMRDYYQLLAYFNSTEQEADRANPQTPSSIKFQGPSMPLSDPARDARRAQKEQQLAQARREQQAPRAELQESLEQWVAGLIQQTGDAADSGNVDADSIPGPVAKAARAQPADWSEEERKQLLEYRVKQDAEYVKLQQRATSLAKQIKQLAPDTTLVMMELEQPARDAHIRTWRLSPERRVGSATHSGSASSGSGWLAQPFDAGPVAGDPRESACCSSDRESLVGGTLWAGPCDHG